MIKLSESRGLPVTDLSFSLFRLIVLVYFSSFPDFIGTYVPCVTLTYEKDRNTFFTKILNINRITVVRDVVVSCLSH